MIRFITKHGKTVIFIANMNMIKALSKIFMKKPIAGFMASLSVLLLSACGHNYITDPEPLLLDTHVDSGPPEYRQGYADGCHTAMAAYGTSYMKSVYKLHKEAKYANNKMYNQAWKDAWNYCYMSIFMMRSDDDSLL